MALLWQLKGAGDAWQCPRSRIGRPPRRCCWCQCSGRCSRSSPASGSAPWPPRTGRRGHAPSRCWLCRTGCHVAPVGRPAAQTGARTGGTPYTSRRRTPPGSLGRSGRNCGSCHLSTGSAVLAPPEDWSSESVRNEVAQVQTRKSDHTAYTGIWETKDRSHIKPWIVSWISEPRTSSPAVREGIKIVESLSTLIFELAAGSGLGIKEPSRSGLDPEEGTGCGSWRGIEALRGPDIGGLMVWRGLKIGGLMPCVLLRIADGFLDSLWRIAWLRWERTRHEGC